MKNSYQLEDFPHCGELISSLLPPFPPFCTRDFTVVMAEFYHHCAHSVNSGQNSWEQAQTDGQSLSEMENFFSNSVWIARYENSSFHSSALMGKNIDGRRKNLSAYRAFEHFTQFSSEDGTVSYNFLFKLFKFLNDVCLSGAFIPHVFVKNKALKIKWLPFETLPQISSELKILESHEYAAAGGRNMIDTLASSFLTEWVRRKYILFQRDFIREGDREYHNLLNLFFQRMAFDVSSLSYHSLPTVINRWLSVLHIDFSAYKYEIAINEPSKYGKNNTFAGDFTISMNVITEEKGVIKTPLCQCKDPKIMQVPAALSNYLPEIRELSSPLQEMQVPKVTLSEERLVSFLDSAVSLLTRLGITVTLPRRLARELKPKLIIRESSGSKTGNKSLNRYLDLDTLQNFEWQIAIGDEVISVEEFNKIVNEKRAIIRFKNGFVKMEPEEFSRLLKKAKSITPGYNDILKAHFSNDTILAFDTREIINNLFREHDFPVPASLNAVLRPYQKRGYNWICSLLLSGFGCILADDMGLGKTVQSIAAILKLKEEGFLRGGCLVVAPAALLNNWEKELSRFAPSLRQSRYHGSRRKIDNKHDVFLTTYQTAVRDIEKLKGEAFSLLLTDEAHLMKNSETRISQAVKRLRSKYRLALSGTPVENRLEDLRSLFDFILPGYLGDAAAFRAMYRIPIELLRSRETADELRKITSPFLLRRLKTDKNIIKDLPEKIITNEYTNLTKEQAALYESVVKESIEKSKHADSKGRSILILSLLTSLKQICAHPRVFDKESPASAKLSGKAELLVTLLEEILDNGEKPLIFSQYVETLDCLEKIIKKELGEEALVYHGGLGQNIREEIVNKFQDDPKERIMLISLRAGGLGLNLTGASHVIHYDLWYNPAVENQATDRAFRIGQKRTVFVHRFITKNSFEEKIDAMITSKRELADMTISSGESWLAQMSHEELAALFDRG